MILCCGEALIDMLPRTLSDGAAAFAPHPGGAVFNTAVALGRLQARAAFLAALSTDMFGCILLESLEENGVDTHLVVPSERPTTLAFVALAQGQARYQFYDENTAGRMLSPAEVPALPASVKSLFFGGISLAAEPCGGAYEALALREAGRRAVMLDPNIRLGVIRDEAAYRARLARMIAAADILKVSDEDLRWLERDTDISPLHQRIARQGPALVCVTEGADGARGVTAQGEVRVAAPPVAVVDTVGAGDTFNAGLLAGLDRAGVLAPGLPGLSPGVLHDSLSLGVRAAAITVSRAGANPPRSKEI